MSFVLESVFTYHPRPIGLHALKLRMALFSMHAAYVRTQSVDTPRVFGCRAATIDVRRMIGLGKAKDARAIRHAIVELQDDPAFQWLKLSEDGRQLYFALTPELCYVTHLERYTILDDADYHCPRSVADFHLSIRYAEARRMVAPACTVLSDGSAAMAGPGRRADEAWVRRTLLPAVGRISARISGPVFLGAMWPANAAPAPTLRLRFGGPATKWTATTITKHRLDEHAWMITATKATRLHRPRIAPIYGTCPPTVEAGHRTG